MIAGEERFVAVQQHLVAARVARGRDADQVRTERDRRLSIDDLALLPELDAATTWAVWSFIEEPILWNGGDCLRNGQHRICAMKLAGVARCPHVER